MMKNRSMKFMVITVIVLAGMFLAAMMFVSKPAPVQYKIHSEASPPKATEHNWKNDNLAPDQAELSQAQLHEFMQNRKQMKAEIKGIEQDGDGSEEMSKEEKRYLYERMKKIEPIYWEHAPTAFEEILEQQDYDPTWTLKVEGTAVAAISKNEEAFDGTALESVACYDNLCKIVLHSRDESAFDDFKKVGMEHGPWATGNVHGTKTMNDDDSITSTMYATVENNFSAFDDVRELLAAKVDRNDITAPTPLQTK